MLERMSRQDPEELTELVSEDDFPYPEDGDE
jgi:hypothetical protein